MGVGDIAFLIALLVTIVLYFSRSRGFTFSTDDWPMALRGRTFADYFHPYNQALTIVPIAVWRSLYLVFGLRTYVPFRVLGIVSVTGIGRDLLDRPLPRGLPHRCWWPA